MVNRMPLINDAMVWGMRAQSDGYLEIARAWFEKSKRDFRARRRKINRKNRED